MNKAISKKLLLVLFVIVSTFLLSISFSSLASADSLYVNSSHIYSTVLHSNITTGNWAGLTIVTDATNLTESLFPFTSANLATNNIVQTIFPGANFVGGGYYYMASPSAVFDPDYLVNVSLTDLDEEQLFNSTDFSTFYPGYNDSVDNPYYTISGSQTTINLEGKKILVYDVTLPQNIHYYVAKYDSPLGTVPIFVVPINSSNCFDSSACTAEFLLPVNTNEYYFYALKNNATVVPPSSGGSGSNGNNEDEENTDVFSLILHLPEVVTVEQGDIANIVLRVENNGTIDAHDYVVGPVVLQGWNYNYREYPLVNVHQTKLGNFYVDVPRSVQPGDYSILVTLYEPDHAFIQKKRFILRVENSLDQILNLNVTDSEYINVPTLNDWISADFTITNPNDFGIGSLRAKSGSDCLRLVQGEYSLLPGETKDLTYQLLFSYLPCDPTIEFYNENDLVAFTQLNSSKEIQIKPEVFSPKIVSLCGSLLMVLLLIIWALFLLYYYRRRWKKNDDEDLR